MPFLKPLDKPQPLWKEWDQKANKKGLHKTVYSVNGDEYVGEWLDNKRSGTYSNTLKKIFRLCIA